MIDAIAGRDLIFPWSIFREHEVTKLPTDAELAAIATTLAIIIGKEVTVSFIDRESNWRRASRIEATSLNTLFTRGQMQFYNSSASK